MVRIGGRGGGSPEQSCDYTYDAQGGTSGELCPALSLPSDCGSETWGRPGGAVAAAVPPLVTALPDRIPVATAAWYEGRELPGSDPSLTPVRPDLGTLPPSLAAPVRIDPPVFTNTALLTGGGKSRCPNWQTDCGPCGACAAGQSLEPPVTRHHARLLSRRVDT